MGERHRAGDLQIPVECAVIFATPADIVKGGFTRHAQRAEQLRQHHLRDGAAHIHLVDAGDRRVRTDDLAIFIRDRKAFRVADGAFGKIRGGAAVFEPLLILHAHCRQPEALHEARHGDHHCALFQYLLPGQILRAVGAEPEAHAAGLIPVETGFAQGDRHLVHFNQKRRLRQRLHRHPYVDHRFLREHAVDHPHTEGIEQPDNGLAFEDRLSNLHANLSGFAGQQRRAGRDRMQIAELMAEMAVAQPGVQAANKRLVGEGFRPQPRVVALQAGEAACHTEHADEARPGAVKIGEQQNRAAMMYQRRSKVMGVLPGGQQDNNRRIRIDPGEQLATLFLAADKPVTALLVDRMGAAQAIA